MSERFERLFSLPENLYTKGSPVIISAGALLKDIKTGNILAQLKLKSICTKPIKAVKVTIFPFDTIGESLNEITTCEYLDLEAQRDAEFGQKKAIFLPNHSTRAFSAIVEEVVFTDNEVWKSSDALWEPLPTSTPLEETLEHSEQRKQYQLRFGDGAKYLPQKTENLWVCTCGAINYGDEERCHICKNTAEALFSCDLDSIKLEASQRVVQENKKAKKKIIAGILILFLIIAIAVPTTIIGQKRRIEQIASAYLEKHDYYHAACTYAKYNDAEGVKDVIKKIPEIHNSIKMIILTDNNKILIWEAKTAHVFYDFYFGNYDHLDFKYIYNSDELEKLASLKNSEFSGRILYEFDYT